MDNALHPARSADPGPVSNARIEAQNALQWLTRMVLSYAGERTSSDDPGLRWFASTRTFVTSEMAPGVALELDLPTLTLQFTERGEPSPHALDIDGKSSTEVEAWLLVEMLHRDFDRDVFSKHLPYQWCHLMTGDEAKYSSQSMAGELVQLSDWLADASDILLQAQATLGIGTASLGNEPDGLLCWPQSFEIGFSAPTFDQASGGDRIVVGCTIGDGAILEPRLFVRRSIGGTMHADELLPVTMPDRSRSKQTIVAELVDLFRQVQGSARH